MSDSRILSVKPIIHYPRVAQVGKTYLMTIDLEVEENSEWLYEEEEYPIYCTIDSELFSSKPVGEPVVILHRFGGSYGDAGFLLLASQLERGGVIEVTLINRWGVTIKRIILDNIKILKKTHDKLVDGLLGDIQTPPDDLFQTSAEELTFIFDFSQQNFELHCDRGSRRLDQTELLALIEHCEQVYYSGRPADYWRRPQDIPVELVALGRRLFAWLDGDEGWLRAALATGVSQAIAFQLNYSLEVQGLNPQTDRIALGLAHLPWELLHDGSGFLLEQQRMTPPMRIVQVREGPNEVANRPLHVLWMATAPEGGTGLNYEQEEASILQATKDQPLLLVVEESGSVAELENLIKFYPAGYFDGFHLTGHGLIFTEAEYGEWATRLQPPSQIAEHTPCFVTEDAVGNVQLTTVADLARAFGDRFPRLIFLWGNDTGKLPERGAVPSMAQALVQAGAQVVLGWARPVYDQTAIVAAQAIYKELAAASSVERAVQAAVQAMIAAKCSDWHLLRVFRDSRSLGELVTPMGTPKRTRLVRIQPELDFLDAQDQVKVAGAFAFVGRRRSLQRCLKVMGPTSDRVGVFIQGMGGLGKSTLAARVCRRVQALRTGVQRVVLVGVVNEATLLHKLASAYEQFAGIGELLNQPGLSLEGRLQNFLAAVEELARPLLLVLDDFGQNIPEGAIADGTLRPITPASEVLTALCGALVAVQQEMSAFSRLIVTCRYLCPFPGSLVLERLVKMEPADVVKKCRLLPDFGQVRRHPEYDRVVRVADGNPRLLEWLLALVQRGDLDAAALLTQVEAEAEFREDILAGLLLGSLSGKKQRFREDILAKGSLSGEEQQWLARLSVFELPVTVEMVAAVTEMPLFLRNEEDLEAGSVAPLLREGRGEQILDKTLALGLVESATTRGEAEYRVTRILQPLLEPVLTMAEWQAAQRQAAQAVYRGWWEEAESATETQRLEIVRLALLGGEGEIAGEIGDAMATGWVNNSRFVEALDLCQRILAVFTDYRILRTIARAEVVLGNVEAATDHYMQALTRCPEDDLAGRSSILFNHATLIAQQGEIDRALDLWQQSLEIQERIGDVKGKANALNNMAGVIAQQGEIDRALDLWQQSLQIYMRIDDVKGKANALNNMGRVIAQQGEIDRALDLWQQSLEIYERIGDVQGKAVTVANMAETVGQTGDQARQLALNLQAAQALGQVRAYSDLVTVLSNLGATGDNGQVYLAQALWLCLRIQPPLMDALLLIKALYEQVPSGDALEALLAVLALYLCTQRGAAHPQLAQLQDLSSKMLAGAASAQGIETQDAFDAWFTQQQLKDPAVFLPALDQRLETLIGDAWLFDGGRLEISASKNG